MQIGKKFYLTSDGLKKLQKEHLALKRARSLKVNSEFPQMQESEDLNPEYLSMQEDLSLLDTRIAEVENVLKNYSLIKPPAKDRQNIVGLGATVIVEVDGDKDEFELVGSLEANPSLGKISNESPVGKALLGSSVGDVVAVSSPMKTFYKIKKIKY